MVCKIFFCSELLNILDKVAEKRRRRTQAIAKHYAFHENAISYRNVSAAKESD